MYRHLSFLGALLITLNTMLLIFTVAISTLELARFQQLKAQEEESTYRLVIEELDHTIEAAVRRLGMLPNASTIQQALQRRRASNPSIQRLSVFIPGEHIVADTDLRMVGTVAPTSWQVPADRIDTLVRPDESPAYYALVRNVGKEISRPACVALLVAHRSDNRLASDLLAVITEKAVWCLVSGSLLILLASVWLSRRWLSAIHEEIDALAASPRRRAALAAPSSADLATVPVEASTPLSREVARTLNDLEQASQSLDELASR